MVIILPILTSEHRLQEVIRHLQECTDLKRYSLLMVLPKSASENTRGVAHAFAAEQQRVSVLETIAPAHYYALVNEGLTATAEDVVLLNDNLQVTEGWLEQLEAGLLQSPSIASVSPFVNRDMEGRHPKFCPNGGVPDGYTVDTLARAIRQCSEGEYPRIPVANGNCMVLRRKAIDCAGLFSLQRFNTDAGPVVEYSYILTQLGWIHVLDEGAYVDNRAIQLPQEAELWNSDKSKLKKCYPDHEAFRLQFIESKQLQVFEEKIWLHVALQQVSQNERKTILLSSHSDFRKDALNHLGGVQLHIRDLVEYLRGRFNLVVTARDGMMMRATLYAGEYRLSFGEEACGEEGMFTESDPRLRSFYEKIVEGLSVDVIHIHNIYGLSFDLFAVAKDKSIPLQVTLHDYYYVCPSLTLVDAAGKACGTQDKCESDCDQCLQKKMGYERTKGIIFGWREMCGRYLALAKRLIAPSRSVKDVYSRIYPELASRTVVIEHGYDQAPCQDASQLLLDWSPQLSKRILFEIEQLEMLDKNALRATGWAYIQDKNSIDSKAGLWVSDGTDSQIFKTELLERTDFAEKEELYRFCGFSVTVPLTWMEPGAAPILRMVLQSRDEPPLLSEKLVVVQEAKNRFQSDWLTVAFLGGMDKHKGSQEIFRIIQSMEEAPINFLVVGGIHDKDLSGLWQSNLVKIGPYEREDLPTIMRDFHVDVVGLLSTLGETFSYTMSEALACGAPVFATNLGAQGQRVMDTGAGWLIDPEKSVKDSIALLTLLLSDPDLLAEKKQAALDHCPKSVAEMGQDTERTYDMYPRRHRPHSPVDHLVALYRKAHVSLPVYLQQKLQYEADMRAHMLALQLIEANEKLGEQTVKLVDTIDRLIEANERAAQADEEVRRSRETLIAIQSSKTYRMMSALGRIIKGRGAADG